MVIGMNEKYENFNRKRVIGIVIALCIIGTASILVDIIFNLDTVIFSKLVEILFNLVAVVAGIWVTCYLLFLQVYKDSYPLKIINEEYLPQLKEYFVYSLFVIVYGAFVITKNNGWIENIFFSAVALFVIVIILLHTYRCSKSLMINTYIDEFCQDIKKHLEKLQAQIDGQLLENISRVLDESLVKEEYYVVQNITHRLGDIFLEFLSNSIGMIGHGNTSTEIEKSFNEILNIYLFELDMCSKINSDLVVEDIIDQNIKNIEFCIKTKQYEWFKDYIHKINILNFNLQKDGKDNNIAFLNVIYNRVIRSLIKEERNDWIKYIIEDIFGLTKSLNFMYENINLKYFTNVLASAMLYSLKKNKDDIYESLFDEFKQLTVMLCKIPKGFSDVLVYYTLLFNSLKESDYDKVEKFIEYIFDATDMLADDSKFIEYKYYCISEIGSNCSLEMREKIRKYHINTLLSTIELRDKYKGYLLVPDFKKRISENQYQLEEIDRICDEIRTLLNRCIICDNVLSYYSLLDILNSCLNTTETKNKDIQCKLFDIYIFLIDRTARLKNRQYLEILFSQLSDEMRELDKLRNTSNDFAMHIINKITGCARYGGKENNYVVLCVVDLFRDLLDENNEVYFINNFSDRKKAVYRGLFNIGTSCIENNFEQGIRGVSNVLGWFTIYNLRQGAGQLVTYLIERANELYIISKKMEVTFKTQTFLLTLFTTVGTYCCKENKNRLYLQKIMDCLKNEEKDRIYTAIRLRTSENDMWNDLFENQTEQLTKKFIKQFEECVKH